MERTPAPPLDVDLVTYREDLKLPSLEDFRVYWHAQMLAAQRYMTVVNEKYSLALHLSEELHSNTLEANIRKQFSSQQPRIVGSSKNPHLGWSDVIKETTDASFTEEDKDLFTCLVRGYKVQLSAADCKRVNACRTLSIVPTSTPPQDINTERETISEVRKFISQCQKDREDAAKFEEQLDDLLRERDFQLREHQEALKRSQRGRLPSGSAAASPGSRTSLPSSQSRESSRVRDVTVPRWSPRKSPSFAEPVIRIDSEETLSPPNSSAQQNTESNSTQTMTPWQNPVRPSFGQDERKTSWSTPMGTQPSGLEAQASPRTRTYVVSTEEEKLDSVRFLMFLVNRRIQWPEITTYYNQRFKTQRTTATLNVKYNRNRHVRDESVWQGFLVLQLNSKPRLKRLVDELFPE